MLREDLDKIMRDHRNYCAPGGECQLWQEYYDKVVCKYAEDVEVPQYLVEAFEGAADDMCE